MFWTRRLKLLQVIEMYQQTYLGKSVQPLSSLYLAWLRLLLPIDSFHKQCTSSKSSPRMKLVQHMRNIYCAVYYCPSSVNHQECSESLKQSELNYKVLKLVKKNESMFRLRVFYYFFFLKTLSFLVHLMRNNFSAFFSFLPYLRISTSAVLAYLGFSPNPIIRCLLCFDACSVAEHTLLIIKKRWDGLSCVRLRELTTMAVWRLEAPGGRSVSP